MNRNLAKSANLPDGRRAKAAIRLENHPALGQPFARVWAEEGLDAVRKGPENELSYRSWRVGDRSVFLFIS